MFFIFQKSGVSVGSCAITLALLLNFSTAWGASLELKEKEFNKFSKLSTVQERTEWMKKSGLNPAETYFFQFTKMNSFDVVSSGLSMNMGSYSSVGINTQVRKEFGWVFCSGLSTNFSDEVYAWGGKIYSLGYYTLDSVGSIKKTLGATVTCTRISGSDSIRDQVAFGIIDAKYGVVSAKTIDIFPREPKPIENASEAFNLFFEPVSTKNIDIRRPQK